MALINTGSYSASKAGVRSLGRVLNQELRLNIKVITIEPWATEPMVGSYGWSSKNSKAVRNVCRDPFCKMRKTGDKQ